jgi:hypothetical protein
MALGWTQPLTEMSTMNIPGGQGRPAPEADNLTVICEPIVYKMWEPRRLTNLRAFTACYRDSFTFHLMRILSACILNNDFSCKVQFINSRVRHPPIGPQDPSAGLNVP